MGYENRIVINKLIATSLEIIKNKKRKVLRVDVTGRNQTEFPANLVSFELVFFNTPDNPIKYLRFSKPINTFLSILLPDEEYEINTDFCSIQRYNNELLDKETVTLFFEPPIELQ